VERADAYRNSAPPTHQLHATQASTACLQHLPVRMNLDYRSFVPLPDEDGLLAGDVRSWLLGTTSPLAVRWWASLLIPTGIRGSGAESWVAPRPPL